MNEDFREYIDSSKAIAARHNVNWNTPTNENGIVHKGFVWDLSSMAGSAPTPRVILRHLGPDRKTLRNWESTVEVEPILSITWIDLIKSVIIRKIYINRNKPMAIMRGLIRPLKVIAVAAGNKNPWEITAEEIRQAVIVAKKFEKSGKLAKMIISVARTIFDQNRLSNYSPITPQGAEKNRREGRKPKEIRKHLSNRKSSMKLPSEDAFWEIVRIAWTEIPFTSLDHARFTMIRLLILTGMRISEVSTTPLDCLKWIHLNPTVLDKRIPSQARTESLAIKHFAAKMRSERQDSIALFETLHHVPDMFRESLLDTINSYKAYSGPMRERLRLQSNFGRIFPEFDTNDILPAFEFYTRLTGEPFLYKDPLEQELIASWKETYDLEVLGEIELRQAKFKSKKNLINRVRQYFQMRLRIKQADGTYERAPFVYADGLPYYEERLKYDQLYFRVGELESFLKRYMPTKLSDHTSFNLRDGKQLEPHQLLFLAPKRALGEGRNGRICDIRKYAFVGTIQPVDLTHALGRQHSTVPCLFETYGSDELSKKLSIKSHEFRHLQNTELFRLGVSDAIITKRFNRNSVTQSYVYDHRSLAEDLQAIEIPVSAKSILHGKAEDTFRMIAAGLAKGPIVDEFKELQKRHGDEIAYKFLATEADGLHTTPYGHCINSFTVEPCPKHLECFSGCVHLVRSPRTQETESLKTLKTRLETLIENAHEHPASTAAKEKMILQAEARLSGIKKALETPIGSKVFPEGKDISRPMKAQFTGPFRE